MLANRFLRAYAIMAPASSPALGDLILNRRGVPPGDLSTHLSLILPNPSSTLTMLGLSLCSGLCGLDTGVRKGALGTGVEVCWDILLQNQRGMSGGGSGIRDLMSLTIERA